MMAWSDETWTRIVFDKPVSGKVTAKERAARKRLKEIVQQAMQDFHDAGGSISYLKMYPTK
jgi:hypothetical protein